MVEGEVEVEGCEDEGDGEGEGEVGCGGGCAGCPYWTWSIPGFRMLNKHFAPWVAPKKG